MNHNHKPSSKAKEVNHSIGFIILILLVLSVPSSAQKPELDHFLYESWPYIADPKLTNNGEFALYTVGSVKDDPIITIKSTDHSWSKILRGANGAILTEDSRRAICSLKGDSLVILELGKQGELFIPRVQSFLTPKAGNGQWLAYSTGQDLVLLDLFNNKTRRYPMVKEYCFSEDGKVLLLQTSNGSYDKVINKLLWISLLNATATLIFQNTGIPSRFTFDTNNSQLAFIVTDTQQVRSLWYYKAGAKQAEKRVDSNTPGMSADLMLCANYYGSRPMLSLSRNGQRLFFMLQEKPVVSAVKTIVNVDIWQYGDSSLTSVQKVNGNPGNRCYTAVINERENRVIKFDQEGDDVKIGLAAGGDAEQVLIKTRSDWGEAYYSNEARPSIYLISANSGARKLVQRHVLTSTSDPQYSPTGKYLLWFNRDSLQYFTYNVTDGTIKNISCQIPVPIYDDEDDHPGKPFAFGPAAWLENDAAVLLYDRYDVWKVDPNGVRAPVNVTRGYGRNHQTIFRLSMQQDNSSGLPTVKQKKELLLTGFNTANKYNGFFKQLLDADTDPEQLTMGPYIYHLPQLSIGGWAAYPFTPVKAKNEKVFLVRRMSAIDYPNLYITRDFITFTPLTNVHPEKAYNWLTTELVHWKMFDGKQGQGILYKPESFDPAKKYPIIFYFYEKNADGMHHFMKPEWSTGPLNISWYVSHGYLVFDPNIYYKAGAPGESAYNAVVSAVNYMANQPWVDSTHMGLQGHSFAGYEVSYLVTRTSRFAAAIEAAGPTNLTKFYGTLRPSDGTSNRYITEIGQIRLAADLTERREVYIKNSPVINADNVNTPLLMMQNKLDGAVPWESGLELFPELQSLNKPVWMLQYDNGRHEVVNADAKDYTIRMAQFFDHYLKGAPAPKWMTETIPASEKTFKAGLELETTNNQP